MKKTYDEKRQLNASYGSANDITEPSMLDALYPIVIRQHRKVWWFLDDEREPPTDQSKHWVIFRDGESLIEMVYRFGWPDGISFDHDLGPDRMTVTDCIKSLSRMIAHNSIRPPKGLSYTVHSLNPVDAKHIEHEMEHLHRVSHHITIQ